MTHGEKSILTTQPVELRLLATAGRLMLEYNDSTRDIEKTLELTAKALTQEPLRLKVSYSGIAVSLGDNPPLICQVHELRYNAALQAQVHSILANVRRGGIDPTTAILELEQAEKRQSRHPRWLVVVALGLAAAALAYLLGADLAAVVSSAIATAVGLVVRYELGRRKFSLLALPFAAAFIGAVCGALSIRFGWTHTPGLSVIVPSLMIVPGPHLINGLSDLVDNRIPMSLARFALAGGILFASAAGVVVGIEAVLRTPPVGEPNANAGHLTLPIDMLLAGVATCGFALFYNVSFAHLGWAIVGGMIGHGLRYAALNIGASAIAATFLGAFAIGAIAALASRAFKMPVAVIAFAGAVTMMPGIQMYRSLRGALFLAHDATDLPAVAAMLGNASQAFLIVGSLALGLLVGVRALLTCFPLASRKVDL